MEPMALAAAAMPLLVTYLEHLGTPIAQRAGQLLDHALPVKLSGMYDRVRAAVGRDRFAGQALDRLEQEPANGRRQATFQDALTEVIEADPEFAAALRQLVDEAGGVPTVTHVVDSGATAIHGDVHLNGTVVIGRDLNAGQPREHERGRG